MRSTKDFINRVVKKMGYDSSQFTVVESGNFEEVSERITFGLVTGMVFVLDSLTPSEANKCVKDWSGLDDRSVITADIDNGVSIIVKGNIIESTDCVNVQPLGVINSFLNQLIKDDHQENVNEFIEESKTVESEQVSLKDYYRLNLPYNKIGRKSDKTLIRELKDAGFKI